ncbi:hypothetical protein WICMUC_002754 [Wickerhamomyces mucosus]|uniref:Ribosomal RNA-processing protein 1 n=1 Tax=Wickerhamomyces mucosus TaxID=1378264 RepID=A0A9P8PQ03_9ASCO|nr:hypothetical protein WICMUC_002754 [Wickerhamomyces mucosus]
MWFSDRPRPQQRLANDLGELFLIIPLQNYSNFCKGFWSVISKEWSGIDHHRLDKFLLLVRRAIFNQLKKLNQENWDDKLVKKFLQVLAEIPLSGDQRIPNGIPFHLIDIYADELERLMFSELEEDEEDGDQEDLAKQRQEIIDETPLKDLIGPFEKLSQSALNRTLRDKIKEDLLHDPRLVAWGVKKSANEENEDKEKGEEIEEEEAESEDEWKGFD